jgi:hypothetical protein
MPVDSEVSAVAGGDILCLHIDVSAVRSLRFSIQKGTRTCGIDLHCCVHVTAFA